MTPLSRIRIALLCLCAGASARAVTVSAESPVAAPPSAASAGDPTLLQMAGNATRYLAVWADNRSGASEIYGARVTAAGVVEDGYGIRIGAGTNPAVASDGTDFLVAWESADQIYAARVRGSDGAVLDSPPIGVATTALYERGPKVAFGGSQYFVTWGQKATTDLYWAVAGKRVSQAGAVLDASARTVSRSSGTATAASVASDGASFLVTFISSSGTPNVSAALIDATGAVQGTGDIAVATGSGIQGPAATGWNGASYLVAWSATQVDRDLLGARVDATGNVLDFTPFTISAAAGVQSNPTIDCLAGGSCYVAWKDSRTVPGYEIYGATVAQNGNVGTNKALAAGTQAKDYPALALSGTQPAVVWRDGRTTDPDVYGQRLTSALNLSGAEILVSKAGAPQLGLASAGGPAGQALIVWVQQGAADWDIFAERVDSAGTKIDATPITVCNAPYDQGGPAVAYDDVHGNYVVVWEDNRTPANATDVYAARIRASDGAVLDANGVGIAATAGSNETSPDIAALGGKLLVSYQKDTFSIWAAWIDASLGLFASNVAVCPGDSAVSEFTPAVAGGGGTFYVFWTYDGLNDAGNQFITRLEGAKVDPATGLVGGTERLVEPGANPPPRATYAGGLFHVVHGSAAGLEDYLLDAAGATGGEITLGVISPSGHRVATDGTNVVVTWNGANSVVGTRIAGGSIVDPAQTLVTSSSWLQQGALAAVAADRFVLGYSRYEAAQPYASKGGFYRIANYSGGGGDVTPPVIASVNDGTGADIDVQASTTAIDANWSGSDPESGITGYEWAIGTTPGGQDVRAYASVGTSTSASATGLSLTSGTRYYVTVRATNGVGLTATLSSDGVVVDGTPPVFARIYDGTGADIDVQTSTSVIDANWSASDAESGISGYEWAIGTTPGGQEVRAFASVGTSTSASATGLSLTNGTRYYVAVRATNGVGLTFTSWSNGVLVDGTAPVMSYVNDSMGADIDAQTSTSAISANWNASDAESGIARYEWAIGTTAGGTDVQAFVVAATSATATGLSLSCGTRYYVTVQATNGAGLTSTLSSDGVVVDCTAPVIASVNDGTAADIDVQASTSVINANWSGSDAESGISGYEWAIGTTAGGQDVRAYASVGTSTSSSATGLSLTSGTRYYVTVRATNGVGLTSTLSSDGVVVDGTAPVISSVNDGTAADIDVQASTSVINANWSGSDAESGISGYEWAIGTTAGGQDVRAYASVGTSTSASATGLSLTSGTRYYVTVRATNGVGLTATLSSDGVVVDGTAPVISSVNDGTAADIDVQASTSVINANWSGSDAESGISQYEWAIGTTAGGQEVQTFTSVGTATSASATGLNLMRGLRYYVTVRATNGVGLTSTLSSDGVIVDGTVPLIADVNDGPGADIDVQASTSVIDANWSGSDPESGIAGYEWAIGTTAGGQDVQTFTSVGTSTSASATGMSLTSGTRYYVTVRATNGVGLASTLSSDGVVVDGTGPVIAGVNDGAGADIDVQASTALIEANWSGSDAESGITGYEWAIGTTAGGQDVQTFTSVGTFTVASAAGLSLTSGMRYYVTVRATNGVGLTATLSSDGVVVDGTGPVIASVNDGAAADIDVQASTSTIEANWSASDPESGIDTYEWAIGTTAGGTDVQPFVSAGMSTSASATGLVLQNAVDYYVTVRARNGVGRTSTASSDGVKVVLPLARLRVSGLPARALVGALYSVTIEALDGLGAIAPDFGGTVTFTSSDALAALPADYFFLPADAGAHVFTSTITFWTVGTHSVGASVVGMPSINGEQAGIVVDPPDKPVVLRNANPSAAVGVPYRYNATGRVSAAGTAPITFGTCPGGPAELTVEATSGAVRWTPTAAGPTSVCVKALNALGEDPYSFTVDVRASAPAAPVAVANVSPTSGPAALTATLDGAASTVDPSAQPAMHLWDPADGSPPLAGMRRTHAYSIPGIYRPRLEVYDAVGQEGVAEGSVEVLGAGGARPPSARIVASASTGTDALDVTFTCDCTPGSSPLIGYSWEFGDGSQSADPAPAHHFGPGRLHVRLVVSDANGLTASDEHEIAVAQGTRQPPECDAFVAPPAQSAPVDATFEARVFSTAGTIASYGWAFRDGTTATTPLVARRYASPYEELATLTVQDEAGLKCVDQVELHALAGSARAPRIVEAVLPAQARCGVPVEGSILAASGDMPLAWSLAAGPQGFALDSATGAVSWTPSRAQVGTQAIALEVRNGAGADRRELSVEVTCEDEKALQVVCGCSSGSGGSALAAIVLLALAWLRRRCA